MNNIIIINEFRRQKAIKKQIAVEKKRKSEENRRRRMFACWEHISHSAKYRKAAANDYCKRLTQDIKENFLDGILLDLNERSSSKSIKVQQRILRRIVEKRQAQALHKLTRNIDGLYSVQLVRCNTSKCMNAINRYRMCN